MLVKGADKPQKLPFLLEWSAPPLNSGFLGQPASAPNGIAIDLAVFAGLTSHELDQQTDRQIGHATLCVAIGRYSYMLRCDLIIYKCYPAIKT